MAGTERTGKRRWLRRTAEVGLVIALVLSVRAFVSRGAATGPAPPLEGRALDGSPLSLSSLQGRPVLVHFWATWCPVCRLGDANIQAVSQHHAVLTVATQSGDVTALRKYMDERGLDFPVMLDESGFLAARYGVRGVPVSFIVDAASQIRFVEVGYTTELGLRARLWWSTVYLPLSGSRERSVPQARAGMTGHGQRHLEGHRMSNIASTGGYL